MASIRRTIPIARPAPAVWAAVADVGAVHERLARGFVVDTRLDGDSRLVTFANGVVARELVVDVDAAARRVAYAVVDSPLGLRHHHASMEVVPGGGGPDGDGVPGDGGPDGEGGTSRLVWIADVVPDAAAAIVEQMMDAGAACIRRTIEEDSQ
jgi:hypothetical protein